MGSNGWLGFFKILNLHDPVEVCNVYRCEFYLFKGYCFIVRLHFSWDGQCDVCPCAIILLKVRAYVHSPLTEAWQLSVQN